jgi:hypothetical protein
MYFLQEAGELLRLDYQKGRYGPYADNLQKVLQAVEGHFLTGYGDGSRPVASAEPIAPLPDAPAQAADFLVDHPDTLTRSQRVLGLASGYESPYAMELLSTVHWVATHESRPVTTPDAAASAVAAWSPRKATLFTPAHAHAAWDHLAEHGWLHQQV